VLVEAKSLITSDDAALEAVEMLSTRLLDNASVITGSNPEMALLKEGNTFIRIQDKMTWTRNSYLLSSRQDAVILTEALAFLDRKVLDKEISQRRLEKAATLELKRYLSGLNRKRAGSGREL
jgi:pantothenate synthetase